MVSQRFQGVFLNWINRNGAPSWGHEPEAFDASSITKTLRLVRWMFDPGGPWQVTVEGLQHVENSPALIVSNHSGGTTILDAWGLGYLWYTTFGTRRPLHFLAHEWVAPFRALGEAFARRGVLGAARDTAARVLTALRDLVIFPGGDLDSWRPYRRRREVEFGGRVGYARLALESGVPVVPLAHAGAQETLRVLSDGRSFARRIGLRKLARAHVFPIALSLPFGLTVGPWPHLPFPARMRYRFGEPVVPEKREPGRPIEKEEVLAFDAEVRARIGAQLQTL